MQNNVSWPVASLSLKYHIIKELGSGSYGTVSLAVLAKDRNALFNDPRVRKFAVKVFGEDVTYDIASREVRMLQAVREEPCNENIVCFVENFEDDIVGQLIVVTNFVSGTTMYEAQIENPNAFRAVVRSLLEGLHYMHSRNVVHRDIKGDNIIIVNPNSISPFGVFLDLGLACRGVDDCISQPHSVDEHRSPELVEEILEKKKLSLAQYKASDVWFLALALYQLGRRRKLFSDKKLRELITQKKQRRQTILTQRDRAILENEIAQLKKQLYVDLRKQHQKQLGGETIFDTEFLRTNQLKRITDDNTCRWIISEMLQLNWRRRLLPLTGVMMIEKFEVESRKSGFDNSNMRYGLITDPPNHPGAQESDFETRDEIEV